MGELAPYNLILETLDSALEEKEKTKFKTNCTIETIDEKTIHVKTNRSDIVDYYNKLLKQKKLDFKIYLIDGSQMLEKIYKKNSFGWCEIPSNKWSSEFYTRYLKFIKQNKSKEKNQIQEHFNDKKFAISEKEVRRKLIDEKWIYPINVPGSYIYSGKYLSLVDKLTKLYENIMNIDSINEEYKFSNLIPISELIKTNYYYSACQNFHYHIKTNKTVDQLKKLGLKVYLQNHLDQKELLEYTAGPSYIMNYCSCQGLWLGFKNKNFEGFRRFYDKSVPTYRDEKGTIKSLERLEIFERFELIYVGEKKDVEEYVPNLKTKLINFLKTCNIPFKITYGSNWFLEEVIEKGYTYDFEYVGESKLLEIGNLSYNSNIWTEPYNVKCNNKSCYSGCSGIGIQRLVYIFLINNGFDETNWPI